MDGRLAKAPYTVYERQDVPAMDTLADAAQEAEFLHAESGRPHRVQDADGWFVYESKGAPE